MIVNFVLEKSSTAVITLLDQVNSKNTYEAFYWELEDLVEKMRN